MLARLSFPLAAALLPLASPAFAEPEQPDTVVYSTVFSTNTKLAGPRRSRHEAPPLGDLPLRARPVFDWVSPVFVWIEEGYAYAETSFSF